MLFGIIFACALGAGSGGGAGQTPRGTVASGGSGSSSSSAAGGQGGAQGDAARQLGLMGEVWGKQSLSAAAGGAGQSMRE